MAFYSKLVPFCVLVPFVSIVRDWLNCSPSAHVGHNRAIEEERVFGSS